MKELKIIIFLSLVATETTENSCQSYLKLGCSCGQVERDHGQVTAIGHLNCKNTNMTSLTELTHLTDFFDINFSNNNLSIIYNIPAGNQLKRLTLANSNIYFIMQDAFEMLTSLEILDLSNNKIRKIF